MSTEITLLTECIELLRALQERLGSLLALKRTDTTPTDSAVPSDPVQSISSSTSSPTSSSIPAPPVVPDKTTLKTAVVSIFESNPKPGAQVSFKALKGALEAQGQAFTRGSLGSVMHWLVKEGKVERIGNKRGIYRLTSPEQVICSILRALKGQRTVIAVLVEKTCEKLPELSPTTAAGYIETLRLDGRVTVEGSMVTLVKRK